MPTALAISLALHGAGLIMAHELTERRRIALTRAEAPPEADEAERPRPEPEEEPEINPGIERGAAATMNWIGYEEYREHLARLAPVEQAAFTSAISRGEPDARENELAPEPALVAPPAETATIETPAVNDEREAEVEQGASTVVEPADATMDAIEAEDDLAASTELNEIVESLEADAVEPDDPTLDEALEIPPAVENPTRGSEPETTEDAPAASEPETREAPPVLEPNQSDESTNQPVDAVEAPVDPTAAPVESPAEAPAGEPAEPDAAPSEKDAEATSVIRVDPERWNSGQPLALDGLEVRPYNLFRHIVVDSQDRLFAREFGGVVSQNPIVTIRFNRFGKAGEVVIIRPSGYEDFDRRYLKSWMARWSARGAELAPLGKDELTPPMRFKLIFIEEPEEDEQSTTNDEPSSEGVDDDDSKDDGSDG
ncbi:MAG: hypothetical protein ACF8PN_01385 [Phycisphaerales bacterium]